MSHVQKLRLAAATAGANGALGRQDGTGRRQAGVRAGDVVQRLVSPIDADTIAGAKLAVAEINAAGGVLGQPIKVVEFDNKSEPPLGADGAIDVIGKGAKAILFPSDFDFGAPGACVAQQNNVVAFPAPPIRNSASRA